MLVRSGWIRVTERSSLHDSCAMSLFLSGFVPVLGLARLAADSPALIDFLMQMAQTRRRAQIPFNLELVEEDTGDNMLHLMWAESSEPWRTTRGP